MKHLKKTPRLVTAAVLSLTLLSSALLCSCNGAPGNGTLPTKESEQLLQQDSGTFTEQASEQLTQQEPVVNLKYGKKYISKRSINQTLSDIYFIFREDGTGLYHRYEVLGRDQDYVYSLETQFVYEIVNGKAVCFFDSIKINPEDNVSSVSTDWSVTLELSKDILFSMGGNEASIFVCEDYLSRIPNFGK